MIVDSSTALKYILYHRRGCKIRFSEILKVIVFYDPYLNEITCTDPF